MPLVVFDIDGTLARSTHADDRCFTRALTEVFGVGEFSTRWLDYEHQTDAGLCREIVERHLGRNPATAEVALAKERLMALFEQALADDPAAIAPMPGAARLIEHIRRTPGWSCAVATGSWLCSARFKLARIGLDADVLPLGTSDDSPDRAEIVRAAIRRAQAESGGAGAAPTVYVGDGLWDLRAACRVGIGFIGVAPCGDNRLRDAGAACVLEDFTDLDRAVAALESAAVAGPLPQPS